jgi:hypothetical protein
VEKLSSRKDRNRALAVGRIEAFLKEFANTDSLKRLRQYSDLLPPHLDSRHSIEELGSVPSDKVSDAAATEYQHILCGAWIASNHRSKRYFIYHLRRKLYNVLTATTNEWKAKEIRDARGVVEPAALVDQKHVEWMREIPDAAFDSVIDRLDVLWTRGLTKVCGNPECPAPYYIAQRRSQRYCGEQCADLFQREAKRSWWQEHGNLWREQRKKDK